MNKDKFVFVPVIEKKIYKRKQSCNLYNLTIEDDESYVAKGFLVHNCQCFISPVATQTEKFNKIRQVLEEGKNKNLSPQEIELNLSKNVKTDEVKIQKLVNNYLSLDKKMSFTSAIEPKKEVKEEIPEIKNKRIHAKIEQSRKKVKNKESKETIETDINEFIRKVKGKFCVFSHTTGKNFGCYPTKTQANKRLAQIHAFSKEGLNEEQISKKIKDVKEDWVTVDGKHIYFDDEGNSHSGADAHFYNERDKGWKPTMTQEEADKWAENSSVKETLYHGTVKISADKIENEGFNPKLGMSEGVFLSDNTDYSSHYIKNDGRILKVKVNSNKIFEQPIETFHTNTNIKNIKEAGYDGIKFKSFSTIKGKQVTFFHMFNKKSMTVIK